MAKTIIKHIEVENYRSFESFTKEDATFSRINLLLGPNNSGKSNFLALIHTHLWEFGNRKSIAHQMAQMLVTAKINHDLQDNPIFLKLIDEFPEAQDWKTKKTDQLEDFFLSDESENYSYHWNDQDFRKGSISAKILFGKVRGQVIANAELHKMPIWFHRYSHKQHKAIPDIYMVRQYRHIGEKCENGHHGDGTEPINRLDGSETEKILEKFIETKEPKDSNYRKLCDFLSHLTQTQPEKIDIKLEKQEGHESTSVLVKIGENDPLPFTNLGYGLMEAIIFGCIALKHTNSVICIEEPEQHLHPTWQRELLKFLAGTNNQYFIATHSAAIVNAAIAMNKEKKKNATTVLSFTKKSETESTQVTELTSSNYQKTFSALQEMGYQPSDLLFSNCVIWVEGPSDAYHIKRWLRDRLEYLHQKNTWQAEDQPPATMDELSYEFMWTGGSSIRYATPKLDKNIDDITDLLSINRKSIIVVDSDLPRAHREKIDAKDSLDEMDQQIRKIYAEIKAKDKPITISEAHDLFEKYPNLPVDDKKILKQSVTEIKRTLLCEKMKNLIPGDGRKSPQKGQRAFIKKHVDQLPDVISYDGAFSAIEKAVQSMPSMQQILSYLSEVTQPVFTKFEVLGLVEMKIVDKPENEKKRLREISQTALGITASEDDVFLKGKLPEKIALLDAYNGYDKQNSGEANSGWHLWITYGRDIENYYKWETKSKKADYQRFDPYIEEHKLHKVDFAQQQLDLQTVAEDWGKYNLGHSIDHLLKFILRANLYTKAAEKIDPETYQYQAS